LCQTTRTPPAIRDAYVRMGTPRVASLRDDLELVVCKAEYDAWQQGQTPVPELFLYMNGERMKGPDAARPMFVKEKPSDDKTKKIEAECAARDDAFLVANKEAEDSAAAAKAAATKAATEPDPIKRVAAENDARNEEGLARKAATKRDSAQVSSVNVMQYHLDPQWVAKSETKEPWIRLFEQWTLKDLNAPVDVSVGPADGAPWPSEASIPFERIHMLQLGIWALVFVLFIAGFLYLVRKYDILRDPGELPALAADAPTNASAQKKAYSLGRTQMALWTLLVVGALMFLFGVTWNENTLSSGVVVLIGISFGTTLLAATAEGTPKPRASKNFWADLVSDDDGPSFHRCQMVLFTIILAVIFVVKVVMNLVMPDFDSALLSLMGISSGTYVGFKLQGK
jgi:hypothetical protein